MKKPLIVTRNGTRGKFNARGLLGRDGDVLSVAELARALPDDAKVMVWTGEAKYRRLAAELTPEMRQAGEAYGLADHHMVALRHYTEDGYEALNAALREGRDVRSAVAAGVLNDALAMLPDYRDTVVRRTALDAAALARHVPGAEVEYTGFTSATRLTTRDVMRRKPVRLIIQSATGKDISTWSAAPWQAEILFGIPGKFRVKDRFEEGATTVIHLEEIGP
jgi:hypothetical protein